MDSDRLFAVILWINDDPVTGNVLNISNIVEPRKAFVDYKVGEKVRAKCPGFGVHDGVIAKIGQSSEKRELEDVLRGNEFLNLVKLFCQKTPNLVPSIIDQQSAVKTKTPGKTPKSKTVPTPSRSLKKKQQKDLSAEPTQKKMKDLEMVAQMLELTELKQLQHAPKRAIEETANLPTSQVFRQSMDVLLSPAEPNHHENDVCIDCVLLQSKVNILQEQLGTLQGQVQTLQQQMQLSQSLQSQVFETASRLSSLQYYVQVLWNKQTTSDATNSKQQTSNQVPICSSPRTDASTAEELRVTPIYTAELPSSEPMETEEEEAPVAASPLVADPPGFFNKYSKDILEAKVSKINNYSKCAKVLLRLLYSEEERRGRSISGLAPNKKFLAKPALDHPERLNVIYDIVKKRWPMVTVTDVKRKLAEALKPSVNVNY